MHVHATILEGGIHVRGCASVHGESAGFLLLQPVRFLNTVQAGVHDI